MASDLNSLLHRIQEKGQSLDPCNKEHRQALLSDARALVAALEPPPEGVFRIITYQPALFAAIRIAIDLNIPSKLLEDEDTLKTIQSLAEKTGSDATFFERIMRLLTTANMIQEIGPNKYASTGATKVLSTPGAIGMAAMCSDAGGHTSAHLSKYFKKHGYKNPRGKSPWAYEKGVDVGYFEWMFQPGNEEQAQSFRDGMTIKDSGTKWYDGVPVEEILGHPTNAKAVVLVDVGGNEGRLVLQDLPATVDKLEPSQLKPIEPIAYDFFTPQPHTGAKAYFLKIILHDWPDAECRKILTNLKFALKPGHSKILINETVIPDIGANWLRQAWILA